MKKIIVTFVLAMMAAAPVLAEKPEWAGKGGPDHERLKESEKKHREYLKEQDKKAKERYKEEKKYSKELRKKREEAERESRKDHEEMKRESRKDREEAKREARKEYNESKRDSAEGRKSVVHEKEDLGQGSFEKRQAANTDTAKKWWQFWGSDIKASE